jgi:hypothetical protein
MIIYGGGTSDSTRKDDGSSYDPATGTWEPLIAGTPGKRYGHKAFWTGTEMIVWGGGDVPAGCIYRP